MSGAYRVDPKEGEAIEVLAEDETEALETAATLLPDDAEGNVEPADPEAA
jgi:hypothetical protein